MDSKNEKKKEKVEKEDEKIYKRGSSVQDVVSFIAQENYLYDNAHNTTFFTVSRPKKVKEA